MTGEAPRPLRILAVEDEPINRALLRASLARSGIERIDDAVVEEVDGLAQARAVLAGATFDVVLLDLRLPDGDGLELIPDIHAAHEGRRVTVIVLTADAVPLTMARAREAGCDAVLTKPYAPRDLVALLRDC